MARLFLFAVGGTGSRVLRALTHLLAAGAVLRDVVGQPMELVPLVVDPDEENGDTLECLKTLGAYSELRSKYLENGGSGYTGSFLSTRVSRYQDLRAHAEHVHRPPTSALTVLGKESFRCGIVDKEKSLTFGEVIGYNLLDARTRLLIDALYSGDDLDTRLTGGFLGNPNIGTIVLNKVKSSDQFRMLPGLFHEEDRIFIISSIFGGTGASGFPVLVKLLRDAKDEQGNVVPVLRKAPIGALTVMPYFSLASDTGSPIDSNAFIPKTKAALAYYANHLDGIESHYYIGDKARKQYPNNPTGAKQSNQDHVVEFLGATAVLHFARRSTGSARPRFFECAVADRDESTPLTFASLGDELNAEVGAPLTGFAMASRFLQEVTRPPLLSRLSSQPWAFEGRFDPKFFAVNAEGMPYHALHSYVWLWWDSLGQMAENQPGFRPFGQSLLSLREDRTSVALDRNTLNMALNGLPFADYGPPGSIKRLLQMLSAATRSLCEDLFDTGAQFV